MTSAPQNASMRPIHGPAMPWVNSTTFKPSSAWRSIASDHPFPAQAAECFRAEAQFPEHDFVVVFTRARCRSGKGPGRGLRAKGSAGVPERAHDRMFEIDEIIP